METTSDAFEANKANSAVDSIEMNRINPFATRDGKTLSWREVNMNVVSDSVAPL